MGIEEFEIILGFAGLYQFNLRSPAWLVKSEFNDATKGSCLSRYTLDHSPFLAARPLAFPAFSAFTFALHRACRSRCDLRTRSRLSGDNSARGRLWIDAALTGLSGS